MGSSYSDLKIYFKRKKDDNKEPNEKGPKNGGTDNKNQIFSVKVSKSNYQGCVNFEKVTHTITFTPPNKGTNYNIILCEGDENKKGKNIFGYYYPSTNNEVLSQLHVYYSVLDPDDPLVVSFVTRGDQIYNFSYSGLVSTGWVRAYSIAYYSLGQNVSSELLKNEFKNLRKNKKIEFVTGTNVKDVSGFKQELEKDNVYRYIYYPTGDKSVLGSECLYRLNSDSPEPLVCPKPSETSKPEETQSSSATQSSAQEQPKSPNYDNKIDPYYLDSVKGHYYDGVIFYFVINGNNLKPGTNGGDGSSNQADNNGNSVNNVHSNQSDDVKYDKNMAVLLELIDNCKPKTQIQRKDKQGNHWSQEKIEYNDDETLKKALKEIKTSTDGNDSTTFILEKKDKYKGVSNVETGEDKNTYTKYTHTATATNIKTNLLFRKNSIQIGMYTPDNDKTKSIDVYFLKMGDKEQDWPFILMFTFQNESQAGGASAGSAATAPQQQQTGSSNGDSVSPKSADPQKECKKCYFSSENYKFENWQELTVDEKPESDEKEKNGKKTKQPEDQSKKLEEKLKAILDKIEQFGKCTNDINILRSIAYQVLTGVDKPDPTKSAPPEPDGRPPLRIFEEKGTGTSLKVVLGSVAGGLVVLGIISAIIYGIYWYNTTIKLLT